MKNKKNKENKKLIQELYSAYRYERKATKILEEKLKKEEQKAITEFVRNNDYYDQDDCFKYVEQSTEYIISDLIDSDMRKSYLLDSIRELKKYS